MNEEQMQPLLEAWFSDREVAPRDVQAGVAEVMSNVPRTRQQGRWWPLPAFHRKAQAPTTTSTAEYRSSPIPASNGHAPTVIGRTQTMLSPVKAIAAGALVFALGGLFLVAQPFGQRDVAVPGAQPLEPIGVTVTVTQDCSVDHDGCDWTASAPRLTGAVSTDVLTGFVEVEGAGRYDAGFAWIANEFYSPEGSGTGYVYALWGEPTHNFLVLSGTGASEGWHYVASSTDPEPDGDFEWTGTLYEGELPPFPEALAE